MDKIEIDPETNAVFKALEASLRDAQVLASTAGHFIKTRSEKLFKTIYETYPELKGKEVSYDSKKGVVYTL